MSKFDKELYLDPDQPVEVRVSDVFHGLQRISFLTFYLLTLCEGGVSLLFLLGLPT